MRLGKLIGFIGLMLFSYNTAIACDLCNSYVGINPKYNNNAIGLRYRSSSYNGYHSHTSVHKTGGTEHTHESTSESSEYYGSYSLWTRWYASPKVQLLGNLNFSDNKELENNVLTDRISAMGDASIVGKYQIYNSSLIDTSSFKHRIFIGGGIKLPTGVYQNKDSIGIIKPLFQPGTGSIDYLMNLDYLAKFKRFGLMNNISFRLNSTNKNGFRFANRINTTTLVYYKVKFKELTILPSTGIYFEQAAKDNEDGTYLDNTGGEVVFNQSGIDIYYKNIFLNIGVQIPLYEHLFGVQGSNNNRLVIGLNYVLVKKEEVCEP